MDRPAASLIGAVLMVVTGVLTRHQAAASIDLSVLSLLLGMMLLISYFVRSGLILWMAGRLVSLSSNPIQLLWVTVWGAGILSALFVNDTICLLMTPLVIAAARFRRLNPEPYLLALATSSNIGSVMTLTGNPQNMLIGQSSGWSWPGFALFMMPIGLVCLTINGGVIQLFYRNEISHQPFIQHLDEPVEVDRHLAVKVVVVVALLLIAFLCGAPLDISALTAAVVIFVWAGEPPEKAFSDVDWSLLIFFAGLFVVMGGVTRAGNQWIHHMMPFVIGGNRGRLQQIAVFSAISTIGSNLFSNVPFVMLMKTSLIKLHHASLFWLALAASSTFAGNLTMIGSVANMIVAQRAKDDCPLSFWVFLRVGLATTLLTITASVLMLWVGAKYGWV
ncbi:MAG: SLC13 family permease [Armatimonadetes bacterium]|nr:SLC13 family permease [Armatimonadota bacterium]